jgi:spermidine synthase
VGSIAISEERGVRYLHFGSPYVQGAMRIARPWTLELEYTRELMLPLVLRAGRDWPAHVLQIGLGSASITRFLHRHRPKARMTVVEILPEVVATARQYFKLPEESARLRIEIAEGSDYVAGKVRSFDLIVVDGFDAEGRAGLLDTLPFFHNCRERLAARGLMSLNLIDRGSGVKASIERLRSAFDGHILVVPKRTGGNTVVLAAKDGPVIESPEALKPNALKIKAGTGLDLMPTVDRLMSAA